ncbi:MAG: CBS domain-containing protein [Methylocystis sp.]|jgi:CBS domain-containing protein
MLARDVMMDEVAFVTLDADVRDVARRLISATAGAIVVVDAARRPIGMVTRSDIERAEIRDDAPPIPQWLIKRPRTLVNIRSTVRPLSEVMTAPAVYVPDVAQLLELLPLIESKRLKRLPVVNDNGLIGMLRRADILRAIREEPKANCRSAAAGFTAKSFRELASGREALERRQREKARQANEEARKKLIEELAQRRLSDRDWAEMVGGARSAAAAGLKEYVLLRFPSQLCRDGGRAINAPDRSWPDSLRGETRDVFDRWRNELEPGGFGLAAQIVSFPDGIPGDAALVLIWGV